MKRIILPILFCMASTAIAQGPRPVWYDAPSFSTITNSAGKTNAITAFQLGDTRFSTNAWTDMLSSALTATRSGADDISEDTTLAGQSFATTATTNPTDDHVLFVFQTPHQKKVGTPFRPHVHFWQTAANQTNMFYIRYAVVGIGGTNKVDTFAGPATNTQTWTSGTLHQLAELPDIASDGISAIVRIRLYRAGAIGTGPVTVSDFDLHYQVDGLGSDSEFSKSY
jgi:hypothetical protein